MSARRLQANVYVDGVFYAAGSEPPASVAKQIVNPKAWDDGDVVEPEPAGPKYPEGAPSVDWKGDQLDAYAADRCAAQLAGAGATGEALVNLEVKGQYLSSKFWPAIYKRAEHEAEL